MAWVTLPEDETYVRRVWEDAPSEGLEQLLADAEEELLDYAPQLEDDAPVPGRYRRAVVLQARELYLARTRDGDVVGIGDFALRARPLSATVQALLRPERAVPSVG